MVAQKIGNFPDKPFRDNLKTIPFDHILSNAFEISGKTFLTS